MPPDRRSSTAPTKPVRTQRTHEENQERAYIAASRRSDRSLEARMESARRASEIHKKRTGRGLRVTEKDVINEEMYEEEEEDLPIQYQQLNAHLHTTSAMFNKKLHDYIATQHGVRSMFMSQYQNALHPNGSQFSPSASFSQANAWLNQALLARTTSAAQPASPSTSQATQPASTQSPTVRQAPYHIPQRAAHHRSFSLQLPVETSLLKDLTSQASPDATAPPPGMDRRMSLPSVPLSQSGPATLVDEQRQSPHFSLPAAHSPDTAASPAPSSIQGTPLLQNECLAHTSRPYAPTNLSTTSQALDANPLTLTLPLESQQLIESALDPHDPCAAFFMSGNDNLPQSLTLDHTSNDFFSKPVASAITAQPAPFENPGQMMLSSASDPSRETIQNASSSAAQTSISESFYPHDAFLTPGNSEYNAFFEFTTGDFVSSSQEQAAKDQLDGSNFINWD